MTGLARESIESRWLSDGLLLVVVVKVVAANCLTIRCSDSGGMVTSGFLVGEEGGDDAFAYGVADIEEEKSERECEEETTRGKAEEGASNVVEEDELEDGEPPLMS